MIRNFVKKDFEIKIDKPIEPIQCCIYCGSKHDLRDEHIFPYALGGHLKLRKASCKKHQDITSKFEMRCCRNLYKHIRAMNGIQSRRPQPKALPLTIIKNGEENKIDLPIQGFFGHFPIIHFPLPGMLRGKSKSSSDWVGTQFEVLHIQPNDPSLWLTFCGDRFIQELEFDTISLSKMLAKIAHCYAIAQFGYDRFKSWLVAMIEEGDERQLSFLVGCSKEVEAVNSDLHTLAGRIEPFGLGYLITCNIRLFAQIQKSPTFMIVAGTISAKDYSEFQMEKKIGSYR